MPSLRYQMPPSLDEIARRNLAQTDAQVSQFNSRVNGISRMPYAGSQTNGAAPSTPSVLSSSLSIAGPIDTSIGVPVSSFQQPSIAANNTTTTNPPDSSNWRFRAFGNGKAYGEVVSPISTPSNLSGIGSAQSTTSNPAAYSDNPEAYGKVVSPVVTPANPTGIGSPVLPPDYKPRDVSEQQKKYGWGGI